MNDTTSRRLNKYLALQLGISRREADILIEAGRVTINTELAVLGARIAETDIVAVDGKTLTSSATHHYVLLNKPIGYVCSRKRQGDTPTIYEIVPEDYRQLKTVGRLDKDSSGLILLTNDGDFAHRMTHPKFHKVKIYEVALDTPLAPLHQQMISDFGVQLEDGVSKLTIEKLADTTSDPYYQITMSEGRNRQIRRTFAALGYTVTSLHRTTFGNYSLGDIKPGESVETTMR